MASPTEARRNVTVTDGEVVPSRAGLCLFDAVILFLFISCLLLWIFGIIIVLNYPVEPQLRVDSAIFSPVNATGSELTATWDLTLRVKNRNRKYSISYEQLQVLVQDGSDFIISAVQLPPFSQPAKTTTTVPARLRVQGSYVRGGLVPEVWEDRDRGSLTFEVVVVARTRFHPRPWRAWRGKTALLRQRYESVEFVLSRDGGGPSKLCE